MEAAGNGCNEPGKKIRENFLVVWCLENPTESTAVENNYNDLFACLFIAVTQQKRPIVAQFC